MFRMSNNFSAEFFYEFGWLRKFSSWCHGLAEFYETNKIRMKQAIDLFTFLQQTCFKLFDNEIENASWNRPIWY